MDVKMLKSSHLNRSCRTRPLSPQKLSWMSHAIMLAQAGVKSRPTVYNTKIKMIPLERACNSTQVDTIPSFVANRKYIQHTLDVAAT